MTKRDLVRFLLVTDPENLQNKLSGEAIERLRYIPKGAEVPFPTAGHENDSLAEVQTVRESCIGASSGRPVVTARTYAAKVTRIEPAQRREKKVITNLTILRLARLKRKGVARDNSTKINTSGIYKL